MDWVDLDLTENELLPTGADFYESGAVTVCQDTYPDTMENQRVDLSREQMRKLIAAYIHLHGLSSILTDS